MSRLDRVFQKVVQGSADASVRFRDLRRLMQSMKFKERIRGDHYLYTREDILEIINLQPRESNAKAYQVKQVRALIVKYRLEASA